MTADPNEKNDHEGYDADHDPVADPAELGLGEEAVVGGGSKISAGEENIDLSEEAIERGERRDNQQDDSSER